MQSLRFGSNLDVSLIPNLIDVLLRIPSNNWIWAVFQFDGFGMAPDGLNMCDFQDGLESLEKGWVCRWDELLRFAQGVDHAHFCFVAAFNSFNDIKRPPVIDDDAPEGCIIALEAFDSSEWTIWTEDDELLWRFDSLSESFVPKNVQSS